jgi:hypothetical protein
MRRIDGISLGGFAWVVARGGPPFLQRRQQV